MFLLAAATSCAAHGGYFLQVPGLGQMNYSDYPLFTRVKAWTGAGAIEVRRAHLMINRFTLTFFNTHFQNAPEQILLSIAAAFPEVDFRIVKRITIEPRLAVQGSDART
jgi:hypothetical protein